MITKVEIVTVYGHAQQLMVHGSKVELHRMESRLKITHELASKPLEVSCSSCCNRLSVALIHSCFARV